MVPDKYAAQGFEISRFGARSLALRFDKKPLFVFNSEAEIDEKLVAVICEAYLKISTGADPPGTLKAR